MGKWVSIVSLGPGVAPSLPCWETDTSAGSKPTISFGRGEGGDLSSEFSFSAILFVLSFLFAGTANS